MLEVSELFIYPIKSLGGISVPSAKITDRGFEYDRRWMLVDINNSFLTQREFPQMALLQALLTPTGLKVQHKIDKEQTVEIPLSSQTNNNVTVQIWSDRCRAEFISHEIDEWFSDMLSIKCRLV